MKTRDVSMFNCNFRTPGNKVEGSIRFVVGQVIVGCSHHGICVIFVSEEKQARRGLHSAAFPNLEMQVEQAWLEHKLNQVVTFIYKDASSGVINHDIGGWAFEQEVLQSLRDIPASKTCRYSNVARDFGIPRAKRVVASAHCWPTKHTKPRSWQHESRDEP